MSFFSYLYENGLWISVPVFILSAASLLYLILDVIKVVKQAHLVSVPLVEAQEVEFAETGKVALCIEGPRFTTRFAKLSCMLIGPDGSAVDGRRSWLRSQTSGVSKVRMDLKYYEIPLPGRYTLQIRGLKPAEEPDPDHRIVFMRAYLARSLVRVVGIVLANGFLIGSVVLFFMRWLSIGDIS